MVRRGYNSPVKGLGGDGLELIALLPPCSPRGVLETSAVCDGILLASHVPPGPPDILLLPLVREIIDLAAGKGDEGGVVWDCIGVDGDEENGEIVSHGEGREGKGRRERWWTSVERI